VDTLIFIADRARVLL